MAKAGAITIDVIPRMTVDDDTMVVCLKLVNIWLNAHPEHNLKTQKLEDGTTELRMVRIAATL